MKKVLSILLTLAMVLTMLAVPFSVVAVEGDTVTAETTEKKGIYDVDELLKLESATTATINEREYDVVVIDDEQYVVIANADDFTTLQNTAATTIGKNYILKNDIDFGGTPFTNKFVKVSGIFEGNGFSMTGFSQSGYQGYGIFHGKGGVSLTVRNLTFGAAGEDNAIVMTPTGSSAALLVGIVYEGTTITMQNVTAYVKIIDTDQPSVAAFIGQLQAGSASFTNCNAYATITSSSYNAAAFIGYQAAGTATFTNCNAYATITTTGTATSGAGGFIGHLEGGSATLNNCTVDGSITAYNFAGGFVGRKAKTLKVYDCVCYADATATNKYAGDLTGACITGTTLDVKNFLHLGDLSAVSNMGGMTGLAGGTITAKNVFTTYAGTAVDAARITKVITIDELEKGWTFHAEPDDATSKLITLRLVGGKAYFGETIQCGKDDADNKLATVFAQCTAADASNARNHRVLVAVDAAHLADITSVAFRVTYTLSETAAATYGSDTWTAELAGNEVSSYCVVKAAGATHATEEGTVLLAVVIEGVPDADWTNMNVELVADCSAEVVDGAYNVTADYTVAKLTGAN